MNKERRKEIRISVIAESCTWFSGSEMSADELSDLSVNGVFIKSVKQPNLNEEIEVKFNLPGELGLLSLKGKIKWRRWHLSKKNNLPVGFAIEFSHPHPGMKKVMEAYCTYMRNRQIILVSKRIIDEFFGSKEPLL